MSELTNREEELVKLLKKLYYDESEKAEREMLILVITLGASENDCVGDIISIVKDNLRKTFNQVVKMKWTPAS